MIDDIVTLVKTVLDNGVIVSLLTLPLFTSSKKSLWITMATVPVIFGVKYYLYRTGHIKIFPKFMDIGVGCITALLLSLEYIIPEKNKKLYREYQDLIKYICLLFIIVLSLLVGNPITSQYRKERTPENVWNTQAFKDQNINATKIWALMVFLMGFISTIPKMIDKGDSKIYRLIFTILIPTFLFMSMIEYNKRTAPDNYVDAVKRSFDNLEKNVSVVKEKVKDVLPDESDT